MKARCRYASKYKGTRMPKCDCLVCWSIYAHALKVARAQARLERAKLNLKLTKRRAARNRKFVLRHNLAR
jgi:hypothetical protein